MATITYVEFGGARKTFTVPDGWTVMQGAVANGVAGIVAECGGSCACATCHVYVDEASLGKLPPKLEGEIAMLDSVAAELRPASRLSCQIMVTPALDGLVVHVPETQG